MFTVVSGHAPLSPGELEHLAGLGGTIVILMGITNLPSITAGLARFGMDARMPVAVVERGYSARQRTTFGELGTILTEAVRAGVASPAVVVIGEVVRQARGGDAAATAALADAAAAGT
jgi:uroporphyrin-III C-methyltransferase